jgi:hypothetical protein
MKGDYKLLSRDEAIFKNNARYAATSTYIHIHPSTSKLCSTPNKPSQKFYSNEEPFKSITKSVTDVSLAIIAGSQEDFHDIIKALPQKSEISMLGRLK